jgi:hypothetical protein
MWREGGRKEEEEGEEEVEDEGEEGHGKALKVTTSGVAKEAKLALTMSSNGTSSSFSPSSPFSSSSINKAKSLVTS